MRFSFSRGLLLVGALSWSFLVGCGADSGIDGGTPTCSSASDCASGETCHLTAKTCVKVCTSNADCPDTNKNCAALGGSTAAQVADGGGVGDKFCQCTDTKFCTGENSGSSTICNKNSFLCEVKCGSDADCSGGRTCDTVSGECRGTLPGGGTDGGTDGGTPTCTPACTATQYCDTTGTTPTCVNKCTLGSCTTGTCNLTTGKCDAVKTCTDNNAQPDVCSYGQWCKGTACADVPPATCSNITNHSPAITFDPATSTGPVIFSVTKTTQDPNQWCQDPAAPDNIRVSLRAYNKNGATWPAQKSGVSGFFYVKVAGTDVDATTLVRPSGYTLQNGDKVATFLVNFCVPSSQTNLQIGFYFTGGNPFCADVTK